MAINTNTPVTKTESQIYKKFKSLSINEEPLPQGDGTIRISPFDDYFLFTFFDEVDNVNKPIDLSNVGTIMISFIGKNDEIRIPYFTNVQDLDLSQGQVLFRITKEEGKKILSLDNRIFYISTKMISEGSTSDESVIYTGTFQSLDEAARVSLTSQINELTLTYTKELARLTDENIKFKNELDLVKAELNKANLTVQTLKNSNVELANELTKLSKDLSSESIKKALNDAKTAQALADKNKASITQANSLNSDANSKAKIKLSSNNLEKYF